MKVTVEFDDGKGFTIEHTDDNKLFYRKGRTLYSIATGSPHGTMWDTHEIHWVDNPRKV